jgi:hypothetical protein
MSARPLGNPLDVACPHCLAAVRRPCTAVGTGLSLRADPPWHPSRITARANARPSTGTEATPPQDSAPEPHAEPVQYRIPDLPDWHDPAEPRHERNEQR